MRHPPLVQLARIRRIVGKSQTQVGDDAGFNQRYISDLEHGLQPYHPSHAQRIAAVLGVPPDALTSAQVRIEVSSISGAITVQAVPSEPNR